MRPSPSALCARYPLKSPSLPQSLILLNLTSPEPFNPNIQASNVLCRRYQALRGHRGCGVVFTGSLREWLRLDRCIFSAGLGRLLSRVYLNPQKCAPQPQNLHHSKAPVYHPNTSRNVVHGQRFGSKALLRKFGRVHRI